MKKCNASILSIALSLLAFQAHAAPITNADVIKLLEAGMPDEVVLKAIAGGEPKFTTSADALVLLKKKGASPAILSAVLDPASAVAAKPATAAAKPAAVGGINPEEVMVVVDGKESAMQYIIPTTRTAARAMGFGGVAVYSTLHGPKAIKRLPASGVEFIVSVPKNAQITGYLTLASFAVRKNDTREVLTGGGYMSYSSGINKARVINVTSEELADQSRAREGFVLHKFTPAANLASGEYAVVLYTSQVRTADFFARQPGDSYFDFGVD